MDRPVADL